MADPFVAEIRIFPFNFPPTGWAFCFGQLLPISQNTALFSLCGTMYGGDGQSTFALPDLQGSAAMHVGQGPGLSERFQGEIGGSETVTLLQSEMPVHSHSIVPHDTIDAADVHIPNPNASLAAATGGTPYQAVANTPMAQTLSGAGSSLPHDNMQPYLTLNFCIALQGVFPPRP